MTPATLLAACAGVAAAAGLVDVAGLLAARRALRRPAAGDDRSAGRADGWGRALARLGRRLGPPAAPGGLPARLAAAGLTGIVGAGDVMAAKAGAALVAAVTALPLALGAPARLAVVGLLGAAGGGFAAPDLWLARRARRRARRAELELADVLDLLAVAVEAGLPLDPALAEVGARRCGLVATELGRLAARRELGVPRAEGLRELRVRLPLPAVAALVAAFERADRHGAPLGPALGALARDARAERARRLHEQAAAAAPRIQLAVALLLVPAVLLLVAAGLVHGLGGVA